MSSHAGGTITWGYHCSDNYQHTDTWWSPSGEEGSKKRASTAGYGSIKGQANEYRQQGIIKGQHWCASSLSCLVMPCIQLRGLSQEVKAYVTILAWLGCSAFAYLTPNNHFFLCSGELCLKPMAIVNHRFENMVILCQLMKTNLHVFNWIVLNILLDMTRPKWYWIKIFTCY